LRPRCPDAVGKPTASAILPTYDWDGTDGRRALLSDFCWNGLFVEVCLNGLAGRCFESLGKSITAEPFVRVQFYIRGMLLSGETDASASVRTERFTFPMNMGHIYLSSIVKVTFSDASRSRRNFSFPPQAPIRMLNLLGNTAVRQGNRGMEGLAISPDGRTLFGMMQNALIRTTG